MLGLSKTRFLFVFSSCLLLCSCQPAERSKISDEDPLSSHEQMLDILTRKKLQQADSVFFGDAQLRMAEQMLTQLPASAPVIQRIYALQMIGEEQLKHGRTQRALESQLAALKLLAQESDQLAENEESLTGVEVKMLFLVALSYLRIGEIENCVNCRTGESCILPIRNGGIHQEQAGSRHAIEYFQRVLAKDPDHAGARWLLNIAYMTIGEYPDSVPPEWLVEFDRYDSQGSFPRFANISRDLGLDAMTLSGGVVADDFDGDGWIDLMVSNWDIAGQLLCYRNNGDGTFSERTKEAGLMGLFGGLNLIQADYDNDGDVDVLVLRGGWQETGSEISHPNSLLQNDGKGHFRDVTFAAGLRESDFPTQTASWADFDNDCLLDLYVGNESFPCQLFKNNGDGTFRNVARSAGVENGRYTKGVIWGDFDNDRFPDLYVSNFGTPSRFGKTSGQDADRPFAAERGSENRLYRNQGNGTFVDVGKQLGVIRPLFSFPSWFWDYNNDGALDLFVASYHGTVDDLAGEYFGLTRQTEASCLYRADGRGGFEEVSASHGLQRTNLAMGANFGDLDNDGFLDFYLGTGSPEYDSLMPNLMFRNQAGQRFVDVTTAGGFGHLQKGHGIAFADFDNDGDKDVFAELGGAYRGDGFANALFENPGFGNRWISVKLVGQQSNRAGIGARIHVVIEEAETERSIYRWVNSGGSFGGNPLRQSIGLGQAEQVKKLEVYWPTTNQTQVFHDLPANQFFKVVEGQDKVEVQQLKATQFQR